jgi:hypothetical protein
VTVCYIYTHTHIHIHACACVKAHTVFFFSVNHFKFPSALKAKETSLTLYTPSLEVQNVLLVKLKAESQHG